MPCPKRAEEGRLDGTSFLSGTLEFSDTKMKREKKNKLINHIITISFFLSLPRIINANHSFIGSFRLRTTIGTRISLVSRRGHKVSHHVIGPKFTIIFAAVAERITYVLMKQIMYLLSKSSFLN